MDKKYRNLRIRQLDDQFKRLKNLNKLQVPSQGWLWEIRNALGMTHSQLAKRLDISAPAIVNYERGEIEGTLSLKTLEKIAGGLNCKFVYAIIPNTSLKDIIDTQSLKAAMKILKRVNHSMNLEEQGVKKKETQAQIKELLEEINTKTSKRMWDEL